MVPIFPLMTSIYPANKGGYSRALPDIKLKCRTLNHFVLHEYLQIEKDPILCNVSAGVSFNYCGAVHCSKCEVFNVRFGVFIILFLCSF